MNRNSSSTSQNRTSSIDQACTWSTCRGKPAHIRRECTEWLKQTCTFRYCTYRQPHYRSECVSQQKGVGVQGPSSQDTHNQLPQAGVFNHLLQQPQMLQQPQIQAQIAQDPLLR
jgi:hypothetical protein